MICGNARMTKTATIFLKISSTYVRYYFKVFLITGGNGHGVFVISTYVYLPIVHGNCAE